MKPKRLHILIRPCFSILLASILLASLYSVVVSADDPPERHILVLIDESGSTRGTTELFPMDPDGRRIRFAEFLVRYLQTFFPQEALVGVTGFVSDTLQIVPMTKAESWNQADFAAIKPKLDDFFFTQVDENKEPLSTRFYTVLQEASESFDESNCTDHETQCGIVLFSDGLWNNETDQVLRNQLEALSMQGIEVVIALFAGDLGTDGGSFPDAIKAQGGWGYVSDTWEMEGIADNTVISNTTTLSPDEVYKRIVEALEIAEPFHDLTRVDVTDTSIISTTIPPHTRMVRARLLPDDPMQDTWSPTPDVVAGTQRWWLDPPAGALQGTLTRTTDLSDAGIAFYSMEYSQYPVQFDAQVMPDKLLAGTPVQLLAWYTVNGQVIADTANLVVDVIVEPGNVALELKASADGLFTTTFRASEGQIYKATFKPVTTLDQLRGGSSVVRSFLVAEAPALSLDVGAPDLQTENYSVPVTVIVDNHGNATVQPTLEVIMATETFEQELAPSGENPGMYTSKVQLPLNSSAQFRASLPAGRTEQGVEYGEQVTFGNVRFDQEMVASRLSQWLVWSLIVLGVVVLTLLTIISVLSRRQRVSRQRKAYIRKVQDLIASRENLADRLCETLPDNPEWFDFCYEFADRVLDGHQFIEFKNAGA